MYPSSIDRMAGRFARLGHFFVSLALMLFFGAVALAAVAASKRRAAHLSDLERRTLDLAIQSTETRHRVAKLEQAGDRKKKARPAGAERA